jgi:glycosyltransferase involved in cell wall biosynthesis
MRSAGCPVSVIPASNGFSLRMRWELARQLRAFDPDLVHEHGITVLVFPVIKWATKAPLVSYENGEIPVTLGAGKGWKNRIKGIEHRLFSERILVNSVANGQLVQTTHGLSGSKIQVIYPGIDLERFKWRPASDSSQQMVLGYVGRISNSDKGTDFLPGLAQVLVSRGHADFKLKIVGDGPDRSVIQQMVDRFGLAERFEFLGYRDDVPELMAEIDMLLIPSRAEAFGKVALEALATGTRVVAFAVGGLSEVLSNCPDAKLVPFGDVSGMADAVLDYWQRCGKQRSTEGHQYVAENFDLRRMVREMEQVYRDLARSFRN